MAFTGKSVGMLEWAATTLHSLARRGAKEILSEEDDAETLAELQCRACIRGKAWKSRNGQRITFFLAGTRQPGLKVKMKSD
jgi:hypothetical protein